jgi:hypothetical protein
MTTTTGVLFMKALSGSTMAIVTASSRTSLLPAARAIHLPSMSIAPVRTRPAESTNMAATVITASFAKPLIPSLTLTRPSSISVAMTMTPTMSTRSLFQMNSPSAPPVTSSVRTIGAVIAGG